MRVNVSDGKMNFNQRNNQFKMTIKGPMGESVMNGYCMCNVTSYSAGISYLGYEFPKGKYEQPEDNLCDFMCHDDEVKAFYQKRHPKEYNEWQSGLKDAYWINEFHDCLAFGANKWMGKEIGKFYEGLPLIDMIKALYEGHPIPTSMKFGKLGHIICVVGFDGNFSEADLKNAFEGKFELPMDTKIIFDDPFNKCVDFDTGKYDATQTGNDNIMTLAQFIKYSKPVNEKKVMCHILSKV